MPERLPRKEAEKRANEIRDEADALGLTRPTGEEYQAIDMALDFREDKGKINEIAARFAELPELVSFYKSTESEVEIRKKIEEIIFQKFREEEFRDLYELWRKWHMDPNMVDRVLINYILLHLSKWKMRH